MSYSENDNLTSSNIRNESVKWASTYDDISKVTAIKITTKDNAAISRGESYSFTLTFKYSGDKFDSEAGSVVEWRSFGHYTYTRNGATTTSTYPSDMNKVTICYEKDLTQDAMQVSLDTSQTENISNGEKTLDQSFKNEQTFVVKKVNTNNVQLLNKDPKDLTGSSANNSFNVALNINNIDGAALLSKNGTAPDKSWTISSNNEIKLQTEVKFSKALTDMATDRYIDVTLGNENVDITFRIQLNRTVKAASANGSGVINGANYQIPNVSDNCTIGNKSAFTALYVIDKFIPGNYESQSISFGNRFAANTKITMMEISGDKINSYWFYKTNGAEQSIDLTSFKRMSGNDNYVYDKNTVSQTTIKYMFVVDLSDANMDIGNYNFTLAASPKDGVNALNVSLPVSLSNEKEYSILSTSSQGMLPKVKIEYTVSSATNDSYVEHKSLALILEPSSTTVLPKDAKLVSGDEEYFKNNEDKFIIPIGNITSGSKTLSLVSDMYPDSEKVYEFKASLYLSKSTDSTAPLNGVEVAKTPNVEFDKAENKSPALSVTGKRSGTASEWNSGQDIDIKMNNIEKGELTVTAYSENQKVTTLLSNVDGIFDIQSGIGTYNGSNTKNGKLKLSQNVQAGTYKLLFEVKDDSENTVLQVPYSIIVK